MKVYKERFAQQLHTVFSDLSIEEILQLIEKPKIEAHGDLAFPCFQLAKTYRKAPQLIAQEAAERLADAAFEKIEANGPYINAFINRKEAYQTVLNEVLEKREAFGAHDFGKGKTIVYDLSSPNIAKPFSMGHLRSTVIGNAIANISEKCGYDTVRINYIGDWGTQFGKLIAAYKKWGDEAAVRKEPIRTLFKLYTRFHEEAEKDPALNDEGRLWFKKLESGDAEARELWQWFRDVSIEAFNEIYDLLNVSFDSMNGEAFYNDKMDAVVRELEEKGLLTESDGALVVRLDEDDLPPCLIKKKDGATLYATRDLASALYRKRTYDFDEALYVVGHEQSLHFTQIKKVLKKMGYDWADHIEHVPFGMILQGGKKMSTRKGKVVLLEEVLREIIALAEKNILEKNPSLPNKEEVAKQVGVGAVIYHDLKHYRMNDVEFSFDDMLRFEGNTGPYLQYTHARAHSILRKAGRTVSEVNGGLEDDGSWAVVSAIAAFPDDVKNAFIDRDPSQIAKSIFRIAQSFNQYYAHERILDSDDVDLKLALVEAVTIVIKEGLRLLGIEAPKEM
ncbi:arginine--tRNA ligase [Caenibacillus caldisaponilyticus]|uniref:arginine--tRNA ligase n=1 Tax=Caenibacillus caldisaponilyticus TaxID=1674942 RepID=UPI0009889317|nr:arginine--tRNA ligase [Caenibacillus caldisaponilyticus]